MIDTIVSTVKSFEWTGMMGVILYWIPLAMCAIGYTVRTLKNIAKDVKAREARESFLAQTPPNLSESEERSYRLDAPYYSPRETLGDIICRVLATFIPIVNLWCALTDVAVIQRIFSIIGEIFTQPLVPPKK